MMGLRPCLPRGCRRYPEQTDVEESVQPRRRGRLSRVSEPASEFVEW
jgi:hypothetical protein